MFRRIAALLSCLMLMLCALPAAAPAEEGRTTVLVGWYESPFNRTDNGRLSGYAYEYQQKIAAYTGWDYEPIKGTWPELLEKLVAGEIDMMSDISWAEDRKDKIRYADIPMGSEIYYLYVAPNNREITADSLSSLGGKTIGVTAASVQKDLFLEWAAEEGIRVTYIPPEGAADAGAPVSAGNSPAGTPGIDITLIGLLSSEEDSLKMVNRGELDGFIMPDFYEDPALCVPVWRIGSSDFYFALSNNCPDEMLDRLNDALSRIQDENKYYSEELSAKYLRASGTGRRLTADETDWLDRHGPIRVGYQDNYLAFCAVDPATGELTGALKDCLATMADALDNAHLEFTATGYPTAGAAMDALARGEIDCMFPANLTAFDADIAGVVMSPVLMRTKMDAVVREADKADFLRKSQTRVAVNKGNPNYEIFLQEHFPNWTRVIYDNTPACLDAVAAKKADCIIISNYRYGDIASQCKRLNLTTVFTGVEMDYNFALRKGDTTLYSILAKAISRLPDSTVNAALNFYSAETAETGFWRFVEENLAVIILSAVSLILLVLVLLLCRRLRKNRGWRSPAPVRKTQSKPADH